MAFTASPILAGLWQRSLVSPDTRRFSRRFFLFSVGAISAPCCSPKWCSIWGHASSSLTLHAACFRSAPRKPHSCSQRCVHLLLTIQPQHSPRHWKSSSPRWPWILLCADWQLFATKRNRGLIGLRGLVADF